MFHDPAGLLTDRREALRWYPDDVWRDVLAAGWLRIDQEEPFVGRTGGRGDDLGSRILTARMARDQILAEATNRLGLAEEIDPGPRQFFDRDIRVLGASRLVAALAGSVTDPEVARLIDGLGGRLDGMHRLPGSLDQAVDCVDVLTNPQLRRLLGPALGLTVSDDRRS